MSGEAVSLLGFLFVAHYLGDFTLLATRRMQLAKVGEAPPGFIAAHAAVHGLLVLTAVAIVRPSVPVVLAAAAIEFATHLGLDLVKMRLTVRYAALRDPAGAPFWHLFGLDQLAHGLVLLGIAAFVL